MKSEIITGAVLCLAMMSTAYATTCPTITVVNEKQDTEFKFTSVILKDKDSEKSVVICRYDGAADEGASAGLRLGHTVKGIGDNWKNDQCVSNDANKCEFE
ncbi:hypothetical protein [Pseudomonas sp. EA_5y_Pfl2_R50]|uniref:hypothetical protein n=1 Tax=Pseudomonas sp. EA_5y_Pfl2_R50 TaxID=3088691 RepID=UPI0030DAC43C